MKFTRSTVGHFIAGMLAMSIWDAMSMNYGIAGGILAAVIIMSPMWYFNHYKKLVYEAPHSGFVDMGLGIGIAGMTRDFFLNNMAMSDVVDTLPTLLLVILGGLIGGVLASFIEKDSLKDDFKRDFDTEDGNV